MRATLLPLAVLASVMTAIYLAAEIGIELAHGLTCYELAPDFAGIGVAVMVACYSAGLISRLSYRGL